MEEVQKDICSSILRGMPSVQLVAENLNTITREIIN